MYSQRTLAIAVALTALSTGGFTVAHGAPGHGHGSRDHQPHNRALVHSHHHKGDRGRHAYNSDNRFEKRIDRRQGHQSARIRQGWRTGDLTRRELGGLKYQQHRIDRMQHYFDVDRHYSKPERNRLKSALNHADRRIYKSRHDRDHRHRPPYAWWRQDRDHRHHPPHAWWWRDRWASNRYPDQSLYFLYRWTD